MCASVPHPPAFAPHPTDGSLQSEPVDSLALTLVPSVDDRTAYRRPSPAHFTSGDRDECTDGPELLPQPQRCSYGWHHDAASASATQPKSSVRNPPAISPDSPHANVPDYGGNGPGCTEGGAGASAYADGFDDGLRDLVARLDDIQRKQAAALANIGDSNTPEAYAGAVGIERQRTLSPDVHSATAWGSGQVGYTYGDGIPTPETVFGVEISPEQPSPLHVPHGYHTLSPATHAHQAPWDAPAMGHRQTTAPSKFDSLPCDRFHSDDQYPYRTVVADPSARPYEPRQNTSTATAKQSARPDQAFQHSKGDPGGNTSKATACMTDMLHSRAEVHRGSRPSPHQFSTLPSQTKAHARAHPASLDPSRLHREAQESFDPTSQWDPARYSPSATPDKAAGFQHMPRVAHAQHPRRGLCSSELSSAGSASSSTIASTWRSRVHMRHKLGHAETQERAPAVKPTATPVAVRAQSPCPNLSRSASILDAAAKQCSDMYSAQGRQSATASMTDSMSAYSTRSFAAHVKSAPSSPSPPTRSSLETRNSNPFNSTVEHPSLRPRQQKLAFSPAAAPSCNSTGTPLHRESGGPCHTVSGDTLSSWSGRQARTLPRNAEPLRRSGPPQYGALSPASRRRLRAGVQSCCGQRCQLPTQIGCSLSECWNQNHLNCFTQMYNCMWVALVWF